MRMASVVVKLVKTFKGKTTLAIEAYATALRLLPMIIAHNGRYDSA